MGFHDKYGIRKVINAAGTMTYLGASRVSPRVAAAMNEILPEFVDMQELQLAASRVIAEATGAEAGFVTASAAAGISVSVAAAMTGDNLYAVEQLPDPKGLKNEVVIQKGHVVSFGANIAQTIRITGAEVVEIGTVSRCEGYQLAGAINDNTAAALYVVSHHTVQSGMIPLDEFIRIAHERGVPVIVDAAAEYDLRGFIAAGADLVVHSGHKFLGGPTSGIVSGREALITACRLQEKGIARVMKVGKESILGLMEALVQWEERDPQAVRAEEERRIAYADGRLSRLPGITTARVPDPTGNPVTRLQVAVDPAGSGIGAAELARELAAGDPSIRLRAHNIEHGYFQLDPCNLTDAEMAVLCDRIEEILRARNG